LSPILESSSVDWNQFKTRSNLPNLSGDVIDSIANQCDLSAMPFQQNGNKLKNEGNKILIFKVFCK
jgi:hypothetical protein